MADRWVPDNRCNQCEKCGIPFSLTKRRHHCRQCGNIFCGQCSSEKMLLDPSYGSKDPVRVCMNCVVELHPLQSKFAEANANCHKSNQLADSRTMFPPILRAHANNPFTMTLGSAIRNATYTLTEQLDPLLIPDKKIPQAILSQAEGFLFLTYLRLGFLGGLRMGSGLAVVKKEDGTWSAPSAVGMGGLSIGFMAGADCVNLCLVLMSRRLCTVLASKGSVNIEGELGASVGPVGRTASMGVNVGDGTAPVYSYSQSRGLFAGVDVNGSLIVARKSVNHRFYGVQHDAEDILMGNVPRPDAGQPLYEALNVLTAPQEVPSRFENKE